MSEKDPFPQLHIASPCDQDWETMSGNDRVRFCEHCRLSVHHVDLANRKQIRRLIARSGDRLCVTYVQPPSRVSAIPILHKIGRRTSALAAGAFSATLGITNAMAATSPLTRPALPNDVATAARLFDHFSSVEGGTIRGTISDPVGAVIPNASVTLTNPETEEQRHTTTVDDGQFTFTDVAPGKYHLRIEAPGFTPTEIHAIEIGAGDDKRFDQALAVAEVRMSGALAIVSPSEPLVKAAMEDDLEAVQNLLSTKPDPNVRDKDTGATALECAVRNGNREMVQALVWAKVDVNTKDPSGQTALMMLNEKVTSEMVWDLIHAGAKINLRDADGDTALISAAESNNVDAIRALLDAGAKVNAKNVAGRTALMTAAANGQVNNVRALLLAGADVNVRDREGKTALMLAVESNEAAVARLLKAHGAIEFEVREKQ